MAIIVYVEGTIVIEDLADISLARFNAKDVTLENMSTDGRTENEVVEAINNAEVFLKLSEMLSSGVLNTSEFELDVIETEVTN